MRRTTRSRRTTHRASRVCTSTSSNSSTRAPSSTFNRSSLRPKVPSDSQIHPPRCLPRPQTCPPRPCHAHPPPSSGVTPGWNRTIKLWACRLPRPLSTYLPGWPLASPEAPGRSRPSPLQVGDRIISSHQVVGTAILIIDDQNLNVKSFNLCEGL